MFCKNHKSIDCNNTKSMIKFLKDHFRYYTMNSWNRCTSYANNVKLHNLDIPGEYMDKAYAIIGRDVDIFEYDVLVQDIIHEFERETGYTIGFNGRSGGYLVLYDKDSMASIDGYADFESWEKTDIIDRVELVKKFDKACDDIYNTFMDVLKNYEIVTETYYKPMTRKYLKSNFEENDTSDNSNKSVKSIVDTLSLDDKIAVVMSFYEEDAKNQCEEYYPDEEFDESDYAVLAERYFDDHDCNVPDNTQWENIITDYVRERSME